VGQDDAEGKLSTDGFTPLDETRATRMTANLGDDLE
jgi:hypothetical protein